MLDIVILPDDRLYNVSSPVRNIDGELAQYCERMVKAMHAHDGIGLAGVQTGRMENIFVVHVPEDVARVFINPEILAVSDNYLSYEEGCLSIPGVYADVGRPDGVEIRAWDQKGKEFTLPAEGLLARAIQHEYDHLQGKLFYEYLSPSQRRRLLRSYHKLSKIDKLNQQAQSK